METLDSTIAENPPIKGQRRRTPNGLFWEYFDGQQWVRIESDDESRMRAIFKEVIEEALERYGLHGNSFQTYRGPR